MRQNAGLLLKRVPLAQRLRLPGVCVGSLLKAEAAAALAGQQPGNHAAVNVQEAARPAFTDQHC